MNIRNMKQNRVKNKGRIYTVFKDSIKKIWKDPVGSNVISMVIKESLRWLFSLIIKLF